MGEAIDVLEQARREAGISVADLWYRYFALGGMKSAVEVEAFLYRALVADAEDRDLLSVAINEHFAERGGDHPLPYSDD